MNILARLLDDLRIVWESFQLGWREGREEGVIPDLRCEVLPDKRVFLKLSSRKMVRKLHAVCADYLEQEEDPPNGAAVVSGFVNWAIAREEREFYLGPSDFKYLAWIYEIYPEYGYGAKRRTSRPAPVDERQYRKFSTELARVDLISIL